MANKIDVLVAGGGMAGCAAAIAAARQGVSVELFEREECLGGNATRAMVAPWQSFHASLPAEGTGLPPQVIGGIAQEFVDDLIELGASRGHLPDPIGFAGSITPVDAEKLQHYLPGKLEEQGVAVHLDHPVTAELLASAAQIVDATGTCAAARLLGAEVVNPGRPQPYSWLFTMQDVDEDAVFEYISAHPGEFVLHPRFQELFARDRQLGVSGFFSLVRQARDAGELTLNRDRLLFFSTPNPREVLVNTTRVPADHPDPRSEGLRQLHELAEWMPRHVPGFSCARPGHIAADIGQRESFRLRGRASLDVASIRAGSSSREAVARGCYPVDIHSADTDELSTEGISERGYYDIPLGCLVSASVPNLLGAGRCISADREGFASARVLPTAMATGQAAGTIAGWRVKGKIIENSACLSLVSLV
jgi:glycine/D-amino acid oxidase-like deaminating enzyme